MKFSSDDLIWNVRHDVQRNMKINRMKKKPLNKPLGGRGHTILNEEQNLKLYTCTIIVHIILLATMQKGLICKKIHMHGEGFLFSPSQLYNLIVYENIHKKF